MLISFGVGFLLFIYKYIPLPFLFRTRVECAAFCSANSLCTASTVTDGVPTIPISYNCHMTEVTNISVISSPGLGQLNFVKIALSENIFLVSGTLHFYARHFLPPSQIITNFCYMCNNCM